MHAILLVDDEPRQLRAMSAIMKSLRPEYEIHTAQDGREALALLAQRSFDAVMTDIRMPVMNGMELLAKLTAQRFPGKLILITGYGDFNYAQQAIRMGVFDYIVKPIGKASIEALLDKLDQVLREEQEAASKLGELSRQLDVSAQAYRQQQLASWLQGSADGSGLGTLFLQETAAATAMLMILRSHRQNEKLERTPDSRLVFLQSLRRRLSQLGCGEWLHAEEPSGDIVMLAACPYDEQRQLQTVMLSLDSFLSDFHAEHGSVWTIGCTIWSEGLREQGKAGYEQALKALESSFVKGTGRFLRYIEPAPGIEQQGRTADVFAKEKQLAAAIMKGNVELINEHMNELFEQTKGILYPKPGLIKEDCLRLLLNRLKEAKHLASSEEHDRIAQEMTDKTLATEDYRELRHVMKNAAAQIAKLYQLTSEDKNRIIVGKSRALIEERYDEDLSLESLASLFHFNASYFSTLFKAHTGVSLTEYIIRVRMNKAEQLLLHSEDKIADIAQKTGYKDVAYFIRVFRREKGITPKKFRSLAGKGSMNDD